MVSASARSSALRVILLLGLLGLSHAQTNITKAECDAIKVPEDPNVHAPMFLVRFQEPEPELGQCVVECDSTRNGTHFLSCAAFPDGIISGFQDKGLYPASSCQATTLDSPQEAPGTEDPEMVITSCPSWLIWMGWDRGTPRTLGNMRTQVALKSLAAIDAFKEMIKDR